MDLNLFDAFIYEITFITITGVRRSSRANKETNWEWNGLPRTPWTNKKQTLDGPCSRVDDSYMFGFVSKTCVAENMAFRIRWSIVTPGVLPAVSRARHGARHGARTVFVPWFQEADDWTAIWRGSSLDHRFINFLHCDPDSTNPRKRNLDIRKRDIQ